ncbi:MAG TPA: oligopeptide transporter, OPT family, partial [Blastocatellia bacterium]|nr:oligopeptide transporter, OPT family [Blastocatellia bacterium]
MAAENVNPGVAAEPVARPQNRYLADFTPYIAAGVRLREFTALPLIIGTLLGMVFGASSLYLVLKVGLTVSASIPVAVISISIFTLLAKMGLRNATILENNIVQTAGSAGESIAFGVGVTMPAIMILGFDLEVSRVLMVSVLGGLLGILMMIPLRRALIVQQHGLLKYPEGTACAEVLKVGASDESRAVASDKAKEALEKTGAEAGASTGAKTIFTGFGIGFLYATVMKAFFWWKEVPARVFGEPFKGGSVSVEVNPALLGVGYIIGPRIASIMCAGGVLAYLVLIPAIKFFGEGITGILPPGTKPIAKMDPDEIRGAYVLYIGAGAVAAGGIISLFRSLPTIWHGLKGGLADLKGGRATEAVTPRTDQDMSMKVVLGGIILLIAVMMILPQLHLQWNILGALLIVAFGFLFVTVSSRLTGEIGSSSNPISGMTVATLLLTCLVFLFVGWTGPSYYVTALSIGGIVCIAASNGGTTSQDLKTGFLVGSTPKHQQVAILIGSLASALILGPILLRLNSSATVYVPSTTLEPMISEEEPEKTVTLPSGATVLPYTGDVKPAKEGNYRYFVMTKELESGDYLIDPATGKVAFVLRNNEMQAASEAQSKIDLSGIAGQLPAYEGPGKPADRAYRLYKNGQMPPADKLDDGEY